ncbi:ArsR/SmtB family transcription factor [Rhodococcus zopfii]|uniref:ArsR/SmtB family transcription factor n=1 Tax=Rhodococcus zopfii TaxID=43772 RepID=UPI0035290426
MTESRKFEMTSAGEALGESAALLGAVADPIRLGLIHQLAQRECACVCDLQTSPPIPDNLLSYHLKVLRDAELVTSKRRGRWVDYYLLPDALDRLRNTLPSVDRSPAEKTPVPER